MIVGQPEVVRSRRRRARRAGVVREGDPAARCDKYESGHARQQRFGFHRLSSLGCAP
jgi:hypothetical protein